MNAKSNEAKGIIALTSATEAEETSLRALITKGKGFQLKYDGREGADCNDPLSERMSLYFKLDGQRATITATNDESEQNIRFARDAIFFGGGGLTLVDHEEADGKMQANVCIAFCKHCNAPLIEMGRCEWKTCEACVAKCEHEYEDGHVHGGEAGVLGVGKFCVKCGRGKPDETPAVIINHGEQAFTKL